MEVDKYTLGYVIEFTDGGSVEAGILFKGTKKECQTAQKKITKIPYSGNRKVKTAYTKIVADSAIVQRAQQIAKEIDDVE